jgi:hypothetical protein
MNNETTNLTRAPEGSIDALAKALGLMADQQGNETISARPWITSEAAGVKSDTDLHIEAIAARLSLLEKGLVLVQSQLGHSEEWQIRMERTLAGLQDTIRSEFQTASRIVLGAAAGLAVMIFIGRWI